jgi:hypothetical protein
MPLSGGGICSLFSLLINTAVITTENCWRDSGDGVLALSDALNMTFRFCGFVATD